MSYSNKHFDGCVFNPMCDGRMLEVYARLNEIVLPEWLEDSRLDNIIRYVIMVYDPKSPLVVNERDLNYRKSVAAELSGLPVDDEEYMELVYSHMHDYAPEFTARYLMRFVKSKEWAAICAFEYKFWESIKKMMEPIACKSSKEELESVQKKAAVSDEIDKDIKRLDSYYKAFFGDDEELSKRTKKRISPEMIAEMR